MANGLSADTDERGPSLCGNTAGTCPQVASNNSLLTVITTHREKSAAMRDTRYMRTCTSYFFSPHASYSPFLVTRFALEKRRRLCGNFTANCAGAPPTASPEVIPSARRRRAFSSPMKNSQNQGWDFPSVCPGLRAQTPKGANCRFPARCFATGISQEMGGEGYRGGQQVNPAATDKRRESEGSARAVADLQRGLAGRQSEATGLLRYTDQPCRLADYGAALQALAGLAKLLMAWASSS